MASSVTTQAVSAPGGGKSLLAWAKKVMECEDARKMAKPKLQKMWSGPK